MVEALTGLVTSVDDMKVFHLGKDSARDQIPSIPGVAGTGVFETRSPGTGSWKVHSIIKVSCRLPKGGVLVLVFVGVGTSKRLPV